LLHRIDQIVATNGTSTAIKDGSGNALAYTQMAHRIQTIAASLKQIEGAEASRIGVFQQPSTDWICSMLAILRVGAVCVPLDCLNGLPRLAGIVKACRPTAVLADSTTTDDAKHLNLEESALINVSLLETSNSPRVPISAKPGAAAVILFTSGTTGIPKGIMLKHSSIRNSIEALTQKYDIGKEIVLQQTAFSFDMSIDEIFVALANGGTLFVVDTARRGDSQALMKIIAAEGITYTRATPPEYLSWIRHGSDQVVGNRAWKHAFAGGDRMTDSLRQGFRLLGLPDLKLYNVRVHSSPC
jgi:hybrid polyketide synthase/nonribosomal peptide synthetase ACE1